MKKYRVKFLIENPEEDCYEWWYYEEDFESMARYMDKCKLLANRSCFGDKDAIGIWEQEYAEHRGWTR